MNHGLAVRASVWLVCALAVDACSSGSSSLPRDGGAESATDAGGKPADGGKPDGAAGEGGAGCTFPPGVTAPTGTQLVASATVTADGVTTDGYAVYTNSSTGTISAVSLAGGMAQAVGMDDGSGVQAIGPAVLSWTGANQATGLTYGALTVWTAASGETSLATASLSAQNLMSGLFDVSADGKFVLYFDNATGQSADLYVAAVDGSSPVKLLSGVGLAPSCLPQVGFAGAYAVASVCPGASGDAGALQGDGGAEDGGIAVRQPAATLTTWTGTGWTTMVSSSAYPGWSADPGGTHVAYATAAGLTVSPLGLGSAAVVDPAGTLGVFTSDGTALLYVASDHSVRRSPVASPSPAVVLPVADYLSILAVSPDDQWMLVNKLVQSNGNFDLFLASTAAGSSPTVISTSPAANLFGDPFTTDSTHALFFTDVDDGVGDYGALAVTATTPVQLGSNVWLGFATSGAKAVYDDNWSAGMTGSSGIADIKSVDTSAAARVPTPLVSSADANFFVTADRKSVVYSWSVCGGAPAGLYVVAAP